MATTSFAECYVESKIFNNETDMINYMKTMTAKPYSEKKKVVLKDYGNITAEQHSNYFTPQSEKWYQLRYSSSVPWTDTQTEIVEDEKTYYNVETTHGSTVGSSSDNYSGSKIVCGSNNNEFFDLKYLLGSALPRDYTDSGTIYNIVVVNPNWSDKPNLDRPMFAFVYHISRISQGDYYTYYNKLFFFTSDSTNSWRFKSFKNQYIPMFSNAIQSSATSSSFLYHAGDLNFVMCLGKLGSKVGVLCTETGVNYNVTYSTSFRSFTSFAYIDSINFHDIEVPTESLSDFIGDSDEDKDIDDVLGDDDYNKDKVRDNSSDEIGIPDLTYATSFNFLGSLISLWRLDSGDLSTLATELKSQSFLDTLYKNYTSPLDNIVSLKLLPSPIIESTTSETLKIGTYSATFAADKVNTNCVKIDMGHLDVSLYFANYMDYKPYTSVDLFIPFVGNVPLDINEVMNSRLDVEYNLDLLTGDAIAFVHMTRRQNDTTNRNLIGAFPCNMAYSLPLFSRDNNALLSTVSNFMSPQTYINPKGALLNNATSQILNGADVNRSGNLSGNRGVMGVNYCYLTFTRVVDYSSNKVLDRLGRDTFVYNSFGNGYNKCVTGSVTIKDDSMTNDEMEELKSILVTGIYIQ